MGAFHALLFDALAGSSGEGTSAHAYVSGEDASLIARLRAGEPAAFEAIYHAYAVALARFANGFVHAPDVAEELVNDVFVRLWDTRTTFTAAAGVRAYLFAAVRHRALDYLRGERRAEARHQQFSADLLLAYRGQGDAHEGFDDLSEHHAHVVAMRRVINTFPVTRRRVMALRWGVGLSNAEIVVALGLSDQAVRSHLSRALRDLRAAFPELLE